ncbi:MAG TPA: isoprenylcysteine carboxylmethyltransferase family protein [Candidatus Polarisedimenticolia bacterium]|nr:isoprenylcysteine carboxylmethyltransferase family protein [Candidatus Polarisedimenticolia bacterium]
MTFRSDGIAELVYFSVLACWLGFALIAVMGMRGAAAGARKRNEKSNSGFLLQGVGYAICFCFFRTYFSPFLPMSRASEAILAAVTITVAAGSVWLCYAAARTLGKQWALVARVIEGHELITRGPYAVVRNPIYLAMFGMFAATGLAVSRWQALLPGVVAFFVGTAIRIRTEERLLAETFSAEFDDYARRVPALFPRLLR